MNIQPSHSDPTRTNIQRPNVEEDQEDRFWSKPFTAAVITTTALGVLLEGPSELLQVLGCTSWIGAGFCRFNALYTGVRSIVKILFPPNGSNAEDLFRQQLFLFAQTGARLTVMELASFIASFVNNYICQFEKEDGWMSKPNCIKLGVLAAGIVAMYRIQTAERKAE